jgi:hypothetical protein
MTTIDRTKSFEQHWGKMTAQTPLIQSHLDSIRTKNFDKVKCQVVYTRTWDIGDASIPVVSGDSIRGAIRRALAFHLFEACNIDRSKVQLSAAQLLVAGGALGQQENTLTRENIQFLREKFPSLAILGGTPLGGFLHGRLMASAWVAQTADTPAPCLREDRQSLPRSRDVFVTQYQAKSEFRDPEEYADDGIGNTTVASSKDSSRTANDPNVFGYRAVAPGTVFAGWVGLGDYRGLEEQDDIVQRACLRFGLEQAFGLDRGGQAVIGLRASGGYGIVEFEWDMSGIADSVQPYLDHLETEQGHIQEALYSTKLVPTKKQKKQSQTSSKQRNGQVDATEQTDDVDEDEDEDTD